MRLTILATLLLSFVFLSNKGGRNAPAAGAPIDGSNNCAQCHSGGLFDVEAKLSITDAEGNEVTAYQPSTTYTVSLVGSSSSMNAPDGYGFQMVALDTTNKTGGSFSDFGPSIRSRDFNNRGRLYLIQSAPRADGTFTAQWTTPEPGAGDITFYYSMLGINGNNGTSGDKNLSGSRTIQESLTSSLEDINPTQDAIFYPNPANNMIHIKSNGLTQIIDMSGKVVITSYDRSIDISHLTNGLYTVKSSNNTQKLLKN